MKENLVAWALTVLFGAVLTAGELEPSGPPGPTMKTLEEVEPRIPIPGSDEPTEAFVIDEPGSYYLTGDRLAGAKSYGIQITVDDVTIDLMGYTLRGHETSIYGIYLYNRHNVEIRNGMIKDFPSVAIYNFTTAAHQIRLFDLRVINNGAGALLLGNGHCVKDCLFAESGGHGVYVGSQSVITGCISRENGGDGIRANAGDCVISGNTVYSNDGNGIRAASRSDISGNSVNFNGECGIRLGTACRVVGNTVTGNNAGDTSDQGGIRTGGDCYVKDNVVDGNKQNNIYVYSSSNCIEGNLITDCPGNGIRFYHSDNLYINNRLSGNSTSLTGTAGNTDGGGNIVF